MSAQESASVARIEATRRIMRKAAAACGSHGANAEEQAIAAAYCALDLAGHHAGPGMSAVEWLRTFCDMIERGILGGDDDCASD